MRNPLRVIREWWAWQDDRLDNQPSLYEVQRNRMTGDWRYRSISRQPRDPLFSPWILGLPPEPVRPEPPKSGSGVKPNAETTARTDLLRRIKDALPEGMLEEGLKLRDAPTRRFSITPAPAGGFIVGEQEHRHSIPFFANRYAGGLTDCLNFIEAELGGEP